MPTRRPKRSTSRRGPEKEPERPSLIVRRSSIDGRGAFATRRIDSGETIIEYVGERISWREVDRRYEDDVVGSSHTVLFEIDSRTVIDGGAGGNDSRFINHSCSPNCEAIDDGGRIFIKALRRIRAGQELTYDYSLTRDEKLGAAEDEIYPCRCGTRKCRGTILEEAPKPRRHRKARREAV